MIKKLLDEKERLLWGLLLCAEPEIGSASWRKLKTYLQKNNLTVIDFWENLADFYDLLNWSEKKKAKLEELKSTWILDQWQAYLEKNHWNICVINDDDYPPLLKYINDWPVALFYQGNLKVWTRPTLAVVGARKASIYGKKVINYLLNEKIKKLTIVSGMMVGVDALAHQRAMTVGAQTAAFLGYGLEISWPREVSEIRAEILASGGVVMSEYAPWSAPQPLRFPIRNRLVAGSSLATLVIEAAEKSGSLITANLALDYGREVMAVPGEIMNEQVAGCLELIKKGAVLISKSDEIIETILTNKVNYLSENWGACLQNELKLEQKKQVTTIKELSDPDQNRIYQLLSRGQMTIADISEQLQMSIMQVMSVLSMLELANLASQNESGEWSREE